MTISCNKVLKHRCLAYVARRLQWNLQWKEIPSWSWYGLKSFKRSSLFDVQLEREWDHEKQAEISGRCGCVKGKMGSPKPAYLDIHTPKKIVHTYIFFLWVISLALVSKFCETCFRPHTAIAFKSLEGISLKWGIRREAKNNTSTNIIANMRLRN